MKLDDLIVHTDHLERYSPADHARTENVRIAGKTGLPTSRVEVVMGRIEPGGIAHTHSHEEAEQIMIILEGTCSVEALGERRKLVPGHAVLFPPGVEHKVEVKDGQDLKVLIIYCPPV